ncbi:TonB C-terminal domain-containing protein [bacterium]|nr:TonB C-terminal domain-containing protein [bacterium]
MRDRFKKYIVLSLIFHIVVIYALWYKAPQRDMRPKNYKVTWLKLSKGDGGTSETASFENSENLPQSTVREQRMAMRDQSMDKEGADLKSHRSETKTTVKQKESLKKTSDKGGVNLNKKKKTTPPKKNSRISDALSRIDDELKQRTVDMSVAQAKQGETGQSPWGSDKGSNVNASLITYYNQIKRKIDKEWVLSKGEFSGQLIATIVVMIDSSGNILRSRLKKTSGDGSFDASAMRAIKRSAPFPIPPTSIRSEAINEGFLIEFNPKQVSGRI